MCIQSDTQQVFQASFRDFDNNIIILSDDSIPDGYEFGGKPVFNLRNIKSSINELLTSTTSAESDTLNDILAQRHPRISQRMKCWNMNLLHLCIY